MEINDVIYGTFFIPEEVANIVRTNQFQRLKEIKQLGFLRLDNQSDIEHHRYAHCLGSYYAATLMLDALEKNSNYLTQNNNEYDSQNLMDSEQAQQQYKIPLVYRKAVQLAALLHDVGHGPFSHAWEYVVRGYCHEKLAFPCIDAIFQQLDLELFPELRCNNNYGIELIKALIEGDLKKFTYELPPNYQFIFEIVSNSRTKIDVDKWDYLKRDYYYLKHISQPNMDFDDVFLKARISPCGTHIEYRYEDYDKIYNLFAARYDFHVNCYSLPQYHLGNYLLNMAVREIKPTINNILVTSIDSHNMQEFLQLTDNYILELVKSSKLSKFLQRETKYEELPYEELEKNISSNNNAIMKVPTLPLLIKSVTKYMPNILHFYGDPNSKPIIDDKTKTIKKLHPCYCDESTLTVYYAIDYSHE